MLKRLVVIALSMVSSVVYAKEGATTLQPYFPVPKEVNQSTYFSVSIGPYFRDTKDDTPLGTVFSSVADTEAWHQSDSGYTLGMTAGWQFSRHVAIEGSWNWFEEQTVSVATVASGKSASYANNQYELKSWSAEAALVGLYDVMQDTSVFAKIGAAYLQAELTSSLYESSESATATGHRRYGYVTPMLGVGVRFAFTDNWFGSLEYSAYFRGADNATDGTYSDDYITKYTKLRMPVTQRLVLSAGYRIEL